MKKIRVCIGSNDGDTIAATHMGDTEYFCIYDISEASGSTFLDKRENSARDHPHAGREKMQAVLKIIEDTDVLVARQKSPNFVKIANNKKYQPVVVSDENIADIISVLQNAFDEIFELVTRRRNGERFSDIPELQ